MIQANYLIFLCIFAREMKIHLFNPGHDIALASGLAHFTEPHAARQLHADFDFLPALWAEHGDGVLVEHVNRAAQTWRKLVSRSVKLLGTDRLQHKNILFLTYEQLSYFQVDSIVPWGWNLPLVNMLVRKGVDRQALPQENVLEQYRQWSHRRVASQLLTRLRFPNTVGESTVCIREEEVISLLDRYGRAVLKAPWSSSGRGVRFVDSLRLDENVVRWMRRIITNQGAIMVEPLFNKVKDFGMEFFADGNGGIHYEGLSLFHTVNGAYVGNIIATEKAKREMISRYISLDLLDAVQQEIMAFDEIRSYQGPFGVDMMIVNDGTGQLKLHPCVEINLRRTMGHAALMLTPTDDEVKGVMRMEFQDHYKLKINKL